MKVREVAGAIEEFAPLGLQESYDNSGLNVGSPDAEVSGVLICVDVTDEDVKLTGSATIVGKIELL
jgi:putative NIF3 family GTP cyclohydrolase 1 type 2